MIETCDKVSLCGNWSNHILMSATTLNYQSNDIAYISNKVCKEELVEIKLEKLYFYQEFEDIFYCFQLRTFCR